jgi:superfamily II DNA/RNA helicase
VTAYVLETIFLTAVPEQDTAGLFAPVRDSGSAGSESFASLGVPAPLVAILADDGITTPFPIQAVTLPDALAGRDILGRAQTGSGKTLGFSLPLVTRLTGGVTASGRPRGLVLVPTRELATQVEAVLKPLARATGLWVATVYGGVSYRPQINALERGTDIVVACPGRLADLIEQGHCDLSDVEITVIDEADQMADLGFLPIVRRLLEATPDGGQRLLFSATLDSAIDVLARRFLNEPARHSVDENSSPAEIEHHVITINPKQRLDIVAALAGGDKRSLVFTRTKHGAQRLAKQLTEAGIPAAELHGNLAQGARARNLAAFSSGVARVMVATDIAARGIHVDGVELVIHADPPAEHKAYVHRSGRTARGGADGVVVTMQTAAQAREVRKLMREAGVTPQVAEASPDSDVLREIAGPPAPRVQLAKPVTELVKVPGRRSGRADAGDRRSGDKPRRDRRRGEGRRADGPRPGKAKGYAERRAGRPAAPAADQAYAERTVSELPVTGLPAAERPLTGRPLDERPRAEAPARVRPEARTESSAEFRTERPRRARRADGDSRGGPARSGSNDWYPRDNRFDRSRRPDRFGHRPGGDGQQDHRDRGGWAAAGRRDGQDGAERRGPRDGNPGPRGGNTGPRRVNSDPRGGNDRSWARDRDRPQAGNRSWDRGGSRDGNRSQDRTRSWDGNRSWDRGPSWDGDRSGDRDRSWDGDRPRDGGRPWDREASWDRDRQRDGGSRSARAAGGPAGRGGASGRRPAGGGRWGGATGRPEFSGRPGAGGKRQNPGQGRHF